MKKTFYLFLLITFLALSFISLDSDVAYINLDENKLIHLQESSAPVIYKNGILFTYKGNAHQVHLSGSFLDWKSLIPMNKSYFGIWYYFHKQSIDQGRYLYKYKVDNFWILDPMNPEIARDDYDQSLSLLIIDKKLVIYEKSPVINTKTKECLFWLENKYATSIYIYGDFNNWNPFQYKLTRDGDFWTITLRFESGRYGYRFIIDFDKEILDPNNDNIKINNQNEPCSIVVVP